MSVMMELAIYPHQDGRLAAVAKVLRFC